MSEFKGTRGPWSVNRDADYCDTRIDGPNGRGVAHAIQRDAHPLLGQGISQAEAEANGQLIAAAPDLLEALQKAQDFIFDLQQELHSRRVADWYPEGANNAANSMSEDMRLLGNQCAEFDVSAAIRKALGE